MNATRTWTPYRLGVKRGWAEFRQQLSSVQDVLGFLFPTAIAVTVILFLRNVDLADSPVSLGSMSLPSLLGMNVAFGGLMGVIGTLLNEREDGTLLRAKAVPGGMTGYLIGKIFSISGFVLVGALVLLVFGSLVFEGVGLRGFGSALAMASVLVLGLFATMPIGAVLGSLITNPRNVGLVMMPLMGIVAVSGIFYPITALPGWVQVVGQIFPIYWLGLGMRSALLPESAAVAEIGESWRSLETFGVLGLWAVLGLILAPTLLRRMARRESGSTMQARRERWMKQGA